MGVAHTMGQGWDNKNENCVYGYLAACTQPKWPNQVGSLNFFGQSTVPPHRSSLPDPLSSNPGLNP